VAVFLILSVGLELTSKPAFGPVPLMVELATCYQRLHWPLAGWVGRAQQAAGCQGNFLQFWRVPLAQSIRLGIFCVNTGLVGLACAWLLLLRPGGARHRWAYLAGRLKGWRRSGGPWPAALAERAAPQARQRLEASLDRLEAALHPYRDGWKPLVQARTDALGWLAGFDREPRLWSLLGRATLTLECHGSTQPDAEALGLGSACLQRACELAPDDPQAWAQLLEWRLLDARALRQAAERLRSLAPDHPVSLAWDLAQGPDDEGRPAGEALEGLEALPPTVMTRRWRAELAEQAGDRAAALARWNELALVEPWDARWRVALQRCSQALGRPPQGAEPPPLAPSRPDPSTWLWGPVERPTPWRDLAQRRAWVLGLALPLALLAWSLPAFFRRTPLPKTLPGRWTCCALINPWGARIPMGHFPPVYPSLMAEEACGYTLITALAPTAAFILGRDKRGEARLGAPLYHLAWQEDAWGVECRLDGRADALNLRPVDDGLEMAIPGQTWHLLFNRDDRPAPALTCVWNGQAAGLLDTASGSYMNLGERGWVQVEGGPEDGEFEGVNSDLQPPQEDERAGLGASWSCDYAVAKAYQAPAAAEACALCSRRNHCGER
jgi:tetratricopeptide (TPR) repeat protein